MSDITTDELKLWQHTAAELEHELADAKSKLADQRPPKCLGLFGLLFGHKFLKSSGGYNYRSHNCWRCGYFGGLR